MVPTATIPIVDGVRIVAPNNINLITPYVLAEQHDWFEDEIDFLRRLLQPGQKVIDIGANYGVYTLSMAHTVGPAGRVWAFEPATDTSGFLKQGIASNGFKNVTLERSALSNVLGTARLAVGPHAELNALVSDGIETPVETVRVITLDDAMTRYGWGDIDFVKIDAEGEEKRIVEGGRQFLERCSPLILYEVVASGVLHAELIQEFAALGYESYRLVPGLGVLKPVADEQFDSYLLNLFCCKSDRADSLSGRGVLVRQSLAADMRSDSSPGGHLHGPGTGWERLTKLPYAAPFERRWRACPTAAGRAEVDRALACYLASTDETRPASERVRALGSAFRLLVSVCESNPGYMRRISLARVAAEYGARGVAVSTLQQVLSEWGQGRLPVPDEPFLAVTKRFETVVPRDDSKPWIFGSVLEAYEELASFSSFYSNSETLPRLETIQSLGFASAEMLRRLELVRLRLAASQPAARGN